MAKRERTRQYEKQKMTYDETQRERTGQNENGRDKARKNGMAKT